MTNDFQGWILTEKYVTICWSARGPGATRFEQVKIPWSEFAGDKHFLASLDLHVSKHLQAAWSLELEGEPLF